MNVNNCCPSPTLVPLFPRQGHLGTDMKCWTCGQCGVVFGECCPEIMVQNHSWVHGFAAGDEITVKAY